MNVQSPVYFACCQNIHVCSAEWTPSQRVIHIQVVVSFSLSVETCNRWYDADLENDNGKGSRYCGFSQVLTISSGSLLHFDKVSRPYLIRMISEDHPGTAPGEFTVQLADPCKMFQCSRKMSRLNVVEIQPPGIMSCLCFTRVIQDHPKSRSLFHFLITK